MDPREALRTLFGFEDFRPGQEVAVKAPLEGRDALVVMPTGSGKSLCYQLPALSGAGLTLVVSPLVSLMQDQVQALRAAAGDRVALVNASQSAAANRDVLERARTGRLALLYVAPERFGSAAFLEAVKGADVALFVVDEAHCVSQWGHDFRPEYFRLGDAARWLRARAVMALTATATPEVARDIAHRLALRDPVLVSTGFDRPNLSFLVAGCRTREDKHRRIVRLLRDPAARPAVVYAGTRAGTEALAERLAKELGIEVAAYHAGLGAERRSESQRRFMAGEVDIVVATNAFGMGIDKADVRTVVHDAVPGSIEAYYQEAGRAGRDGAPARCVLFAEPRDKALHTFFIKRARVEESDCARAAAVLARAGEDGRYDVPLRALGAEEDQARAVLGVLGRAGVLQPAPCPPDRAVGRLLAPFDGRAAARARGLARDAESARWRQYRAVWRFVEQPACRRETMLRHFGDPAAPAPLPGMSCCDHCDPAAAPGPPPAVAQRRGSAARSGGGTADGGPDLPAPELDGAIVELVGAVDPPVGRTRAVEILRGGRSQAIARHSYDGLPLYGAFAHLRGPDVLERVDALLAAGRLGSSGGRYPTLRAGAASGLAAGALAGS